MDSKMDHWLSLKTSFPAALVLSVSLVLVGGYLYYRNKFDYWRRRGIRGPRPVPLFGTLLALLRADRMKVDLEWVKRYGKLYGLYLGTKPRLVVADPEVMRQICIKDFDAFTNHHLNEFANKYQRSFLFFLQGEHWKKVRALMSPTFTSGKIKRMFRFLDDCADDLVLCFEERLTGTDSGATGVVVDTKQIYNLYTMDAISTCCYGLKLERASRSGERPASEKQAGLREEFVNFGNRFFNTGNFRALVYASTPGALLHLLRFKVTPERSMDPLAGRVASLVDSRRHAGRKFDDYLQLLVDARLEDELELDEMDQAEHHHAGLTHQSLLDDQRRLVAQLAGGGVRATQLEASSRLSDMEVLAGGMFLLAVGLETTGTLLAFCTYALAFHQDVQQRLYEELAKIVEFHEDKHRFTFGYEPLTANRYLDSVISETLRRLAPLVQMDRVANADYRIEKYHLDIPKGSVITLALYALMNDPDSWSEPHAFNPERFMPGNRERIVPGSYVPFGIGPRHCLGMRFSLTETKLALAKVLMNFRFEPAPGTEFPPVAKQTLMLNNRAKPIVKLVRRERPTIS